MDRGRRRLLGGILAGVTAGTAGCITQALSAPENPPHARHFPTHVWAADKENPPTGPRIFDTEADALEHRLDLKGSDGFVEFVRETDFQAEYLVLVQGIGAGYGHTFTLREATRDGDTLNVTIDEWPPNDNKPHPDAIIMHSIAVRESLHGHGLPTEVPTTIHRDADRPLHEQFSERIDYRL